MLGIVARRFGAVQGRLRADCHTLLRIGPPPVILLSLASQHWHSSRWEYPAVRRTLIKLMGALALAGALVIIAGQGALGQRGGGQLAPQAQRQAEQRANQQAAQQSSAPALYLALGDSITFGYDPQLNAQYATNFTGYPAVVARAYSWQVENFACPGSTSAYAISFSGADWQCGSYRAQYPLHVQYVATQLEVARAFVAASTQASSMHSSTLPRIALISIMLGLDDLELVGTQCSWGASCVQAALPQMLSSLSVNLDDIIRTLRGAGYSGRVLLLTYYAINTDPQMTYYIQQVNSAIQAVAQQDGATLVDVYSAFKTASAPYGGDNCAAGLLIQLTPTTCDLHPSVAGQQLLAQIVEQALGAILPGASPGASGQ